MVEGKRINILVIDDEEGTSLGIAEKLELNKSYNFKADYAFNGEEGLEKIKRGIQEKKPYDAVICDLVMPGIWGDKVLEDALARDPYLCFIMLTGFGTIENAVLCMEKGAYYYFTKPIGMGKDEAKSDDVSESVKVVFKRLFETIKRGVIEKKIRATMQYVLTTLDIETIFNRITDAVDIIFNPEEYLLAIIETQGLKIIRITINKVRIKNLESFEENLTGNEGFIKRTLETKRPLLISNIVDNKDETGFLVDPLGKDSKSLLAVPLIVLENVYGILEIESNKVNKFTQFDIDVLQEYGNAAAIALHNQRNANRIIECQKREHEDYIGFFNSITHQIKTPLHNINLAVNASLERIDDQPHVRENLGKIHRNSQLVEKMVNEVLLDYKDKMQEMNLVEIFSQIRNIFREEDRIKWPAPKDLDVMLHCKPRQIMFVIESLISNALDAIENKKGGYLNITREIITDEKKMIRLSFEDNGCGIKKEWKDKIFNAIFSTKSEQIGSGIALFLSKNFIGGHEGNIYIFEDRESTGTTFRLELPIIIKG
ncbi:MAG: response regulator [bacterium]